MRLRILITAYRYEYIKIYTFVKKDSANDNGNPNYRFDRDDLDNH